MSVLERHSRTAGDLLPRWRWLTTFVAGIILWFLGGILGGLVGAAIAGDATAVLGHAGPMIALAVVQTGVVVIGIRYVWRIVHGGWRSIGFTTDGWRQEALYGALAGLGFALLQYFVVLPLTGGAQRSDVVASAEIIGTSVSSLIAAVILGWLVGAFAEEVFYRGHLIRSLMNLLGGQAWALVVSSIFSIALFAYGHAYQGSIGMLNAALVGSFYTALFLWRGKLTSSIFAHGVYNTLAISAIYFLLT